jgi:hypothetical protein
VRCVPVQKVGNSMTSTSLNYHNIEFICMRGYIPENKHKQKIMDSVCSEIYLEDGKQLIPDESLHTRFNEILQTVIDDLRQNGIEPEPYREMLVVFEAERLTVRKFMSDDLPALFGIMRKRNGYTYRSDGVA